jgi:uncharacterized cofD-like protein
MIAGQRVVALGGGHGTAVTLRAARRYASCLTAVVSTADDGGSSGRLRDVLALPALGDLRKCLGALAAPDSSVAPLLEHRYAEGALRGHALGNLWLAGLVEREGSLMAAIAEASRQLGTVGTVLPATEVPTELRADLAEGALVGQAAIGRAGSLHRVSLLPAEARAPSAAVEAITGADQVLIGPGSLFTSVLASLVAPGITQALRAAAGRVVYVANLEPQPPETSGFSVADHVAALERHGVAPDVVVWDPDAGLLPGNLGVRAVAAPLRGANRRVHDPVRLGEVLRTL